MLSRRIRIGVQTAAFLTALVGIVNLLSAANPGLPVRIEVLEPLFPFGVRASGHVFAAISGFILLTLAANLLRRKRVAWLLTVGLLLISIVSHLIKGLDYEECVLAGILLIHLLWMQDVFTAESDRPSITQGVRVLVGALLFTLAYGTIGFYALDGQFQTDFSLRQSIRQTLAVFFTAENAGLEPKTRFGEFFVNSLYVVGASTLIYALLMLLRPVLLRGEAASESERRRAKKIIDDYGNTSLARLSLLKDKSYFFSPSAQTVIAYVAKGRAAIALGDPIGELADRDEAIISFKDYCERNDWYPAFYEVPGDELERYRSLGFRLLQVGEEAIVDLNSFSLKGKANQNLRTAINRLTKEGFSAQLHKPPIANELLQQLKPVSDEWLRAKQGAEKQFSIGWFDIDYLRECFITTVYDSNGEIAAFISMMSDYNQPEVTVDLMRYRENVPNGTMEFIFASTMQQLQQLGLERFNFSLSPLAGVGQAPDSQRTEKALHYLSQHLNQFYNFHGLHNFKEKFQPKWEPRYLAYPRFSALSDIVVGLIRADSGDRLMDYIKPGSG